MDEFSFAYSWTAHDLSIPFPFAETFSIIVAFEFFSACIIMLSLTLLSVLMSMITGSFVSVVMRINFPLSGFPPNPFSFASSGCLFLASSKLIISAILTNTVFHLQLYELVQLYCIFQWKSLHYRLNET